MGTNWDKNGDKKIIITLHAQCQAGTGQMGMEISSDPEYKTIITMSVISSIMNNLSEWNPSNQSDRTNESR